MEKIDNLDMSTYDVEIFFEKYLCDAKDKVVSIDKAFKFFIYTYNIGETKENLNEFIVGFLKGGYEVANLDGVLFFYDTAWKEVE